MNVGTETNDIFLEIRSTRCGHDLDGHMLAEFLADLGRLEGKLTSRDENDDLDR